jgi:hypothetical protein
MGRSKNGLLKSGPYKSVQDELLESLHKGFRTDGAI